MPHQSVTSPEPAAPSRLPATPRGLLLTIGSYQGTLAAAREMGRLGMPVVLADSSPDCLTAASRYITRRVDCPALDAPMVFLKWLVEFGRAEPGYVLYPTSDDLIWLMDTHRDLLARYFFLYQPAQGALHAILNKRRLYESCRAFGVDRPKFWVLADGEGSQFASLDDIRFPVLVKPPTQALLKVNVKGVVAENAAQLASALDVFDRRFRYHDELIKADPEAQVMLLQRYYASAAMRIYSISGFYCPEAGVYLLRGAQKILQVPFRIGVGLCFESRPVHAELAQQLRQLLDGMQYKGIFEAEFIRRDGQEHYMLIDLNTRFYGQMGFEIARGLPMTQLMVAAASGDLDQVRVLAAQAQQWDHTAEWKCRAQWMLRLYMFTLWLGRSLRWSERRRWLRWSTTGQTFDPIAAPDDPGPAQAHRRYLLGRLLKHPRSTLKNLLRA